MKDHKPSNGEIDGRVEHTQNHINIIDQFLNHPGSLEIENIAQILQTVLVNQVVILQLLKSTP